MQKIKLECNTDTCNVFIGVNFFDNRQLFSDVIPLANHFIVIADENVAPLYAVPLLSYFSDKKCDLITVPAGEESKSREVKQQIEDQMLDLGCGRDTAIVAVGGGVITDLGGYVAATYCRGIPSVYIPTTLLAMVDAAIGGKTGVNTSFGKNLIGSFYQPMHVFCDINVLRTLSSDELANGLVETLKHALIVDNSFFHQLVLLLDKLNTQQSLIVEELEGLITRSCQIKCDIVAADEHERNGRRQLLNFGHTIAHGIEVLKDYRTSHGQAVLAGLWVESCLSNLCGYLSDSAFTTIKLALRKIKFSTPLKVATLQLPRLKQLLKLDKKSVSAQAHFVLLDDIGKAHVEQNNYSFPIAEEKLDQALRLWLEQGQQ